VIYRAPGGKYVQSFEKHRNHIRFHVDSDSVPRRRERRDTVRILSAISKVYWKMFRIFPNL